MLKQYFYDEFCIIELILIIADFFACCFSCCNTQFTHWARWKL